MKRIISVILIAIMILGCFAAGGDSFSGIADVFKVKAHAAGSCVYNTSYSYVTGNSSTVSIPEAHTEFYSDETFFINIQATEDVYIKGGNLYIYKDNALYSNVDIKESVGFSNYIRWCYHTMNNVQAGEYYFYFDLIYSAPTESSNNSSIRTDNYYFTVKNRDLSKPTATISSTKTNWWSNPLVSISLYDDVGVAGCYWGKSSSYSSNDYKTFSGDSTTEKISDLITEEGTYYLKVKDTSGKLSITYSITFYKTTFETNGGLLSRQSVLSEQGKPFMLPEPTKEGFIFVEWCPTPEEDGEWYNAGEEYTPAGNTKLYAIWADNRPSGTIISENNVSSYQNVTLSLKNGMYSSADLEGYFWGTSSDYSKNTFFATTASKVTETVYSAGTYYLNVKDTSGYISDTKSITFYKTTLNTNGGSVSPSSVLTASGNSFTLPSPTRTGYTLSSWNTSSNGNGTAYNGTYTPTASRTLYAIWADSTKPSGAITSTNSVSSTQTVTLIMSDNVGIAGYYWGTSSTYSNNTFASTSSTSVTKTVSSAGTYYLTVKDTSGNISDTKSITFYKTTLNANSGSVSPASVLTASGYSFTLPLPTRSGYTFSNWNTSSDGTGTAYNGTYTPTTSKTLYAIWTDSTKPSGTIISTNNVSSTQTVTLTMYDDVGIAGYYWGTSSSYSSNTYTSTSSTSVTKTVSSAGTYYLAVKDTSGNISSVCSITFYKTTLNANSGSVSPASVLTASGYSFNLPVPEKPGFIYNNWNTSSDGTGTAYNGTYTPTASKTLYAIWTDSTKPSSTISSTNNVSSTQTVTLSLSDNVGIAGYYWGTSSSYSSNTYTSTSSTSVTKTVSSEGTYYLTVKDTAGNISDTKSITFYKTTLNANGGSVSPTSVLTASGNTFTLPTPTYNDYIFKEWNISSSGSGTNYSGTYTPSSSRTLYAQWTSIPVENIYNLGDETYSFNNYPDTTCSQGGHCFGMAVTSSGYYTGNLDKSIIGGNNNSSLYSFADTPTVRKPICHYFKIQGSVGPEDSIGAEREAIVAGGTYDLTGRVNTQSDWIGCVNYVKSHNYDNKGNLNIGMYFYVGGGHQVNFLYYKEVSGQQRIYAYDNNSPEKEIYYYMGSDNFIHMGPTDYIISLYGYDYKIDCLDLMDVSVYYPLANSYKPYRFIYANKNEIIVEDATYSILKCGPETKDYVVYEIPMDTKEVTITPLVEGASFQYLDNDYSFGTVDEKTYGVLEIPSKNAVEGQSTEFTIKNAPNESKAEYTVKFVSDGKAISEKKLKEGDAIVKPDDPVKEDYIFKGWTPEVPVTMPAYDLTFTALFEKKDTPSNPDNPTPSIPNISIKNYTKTLSVDYKSKITFNVENVPLGYEVVWNVNGKDYKGSSYTINSATEKEYKITVSLVKDGKTVKTSDEEVVKVDTGFFAKIIAFFRSLFKALPEYVDNEK